MYFVRTPQRKIDSFMFGNKFYMFSKFNWKKMPLFWWWQWHSAKYANSDIQDVEYIEYIANQNVQIRIYRIYRVYPKPRRHIISPFQVWEFATKILKTLDQVHWNFLCCWHHWSSSNQSTHSNFVRKTKCANCKHWKKRSLITLILASNHCTHIILKICKGWL